MDSLYFVPHLLRHAAAASFNIASPCPKVAIWSIDRMRVTLRACGLLERRQTPHMIRMPVGHQNMANAAGLSAKFIHGS
jgi:hypothetical protein